MDALSSEYGNNNMEHIFARGLTGLQLLCSLRLLLYFYYLCYKSEVPAYLQKQTSTNLYSD